MSARTILLVIFSLALIALGALWWLGAPRRESARAVDATRIESSTELPRTEPLVQPKAEARAPAPVANALSLWTPSAEDLVDAFWVEGHVLLPAGRPAEDVVTLEARGRAFRSGGRHIVQIGSDGVFRLAFRAQSKTGTLHLSSRFLYLDDPKIQLPYEGPPLELAVQLRGVLNGRILLSPLAEAHRSELRATRLGLWSKSWADSPDGRARSPQAELDADGSFELDCVPMAPDWELTLSTGAFAGVKRSGIAVEPGAIVHVDLATQLCAVLRGVVVDESGAALPGASFEHVAQGAGEPKRMRLKLTSSRDGTFELAGIPLGNGSLVTSLPGCLSRSTGLVELAEAQVLDGLKIVLERGKSITGHVTWPDKQPATGATVSATFLEELVPGEGHRLESRSVRTKTDAAGSFRLDGVAGSGVRVIAYATDREEPARARWNTVRELDGPPSTELSLVLARPCTIRGRVLDTGGNPPASFSIFARPIWRLELSDGYVTTESPDDSKSADGSFVLGGLFPTTYEVRASVPGLKESEPQRIELPGTGQPVEILVARPGGISGLVLDPHGTAVGGARVRDAELPESPGVQCDAAGRFRLERVAPGSHALVARAQGWAASEPEHVEVGSSASIEGLVLRLRVAGRIQGQVLDVGGRAEAGRPIRLEGKGGTRNACSDARGQFLFDDLAAGNYQVYTRATEAELTAEPRGSRRRWSTSNDLVPREASISLGEGETARVSLKPESPPADLILIRGRVQSGGRPVEGCEVSAFRMIPGGLSTTPVATSVADGSFRLQVAGAGPYSFSLSPAGDATETRLQMSIAANSTVDVVLELPSGNIRGVTVDREGRSVGRVRLNLQSQGGSSDAPVFGMGGSIQSDAQGRFEFAHVAPGTYSITANDRPESLVRQGKTTQGGFVVRDGAGLDGVKFVLLPGCRVECSVRRPDGQPGAGVRIAVREESGEGWPDGWTTDSVGRVVIDGLPPGRYSFQARAGQCASQETESIALGESAPTKLYFALQDATDLYVTFLDAAGNPASAWVEVLDARGRTAIRSWGSGDSGVEPTGLHFGPLPPGTYTLRTQKGGGTLDQQVKLSGERTLSLTLHPPN